MIQNCLNLQTTAGPLYDNPKLSPIGVYSSRKKGLSACYSALRVDLDLLRGYSRQTGEGSSSEFLEQRKQVFHSVEKNHQGLRSLV